MRRSRVLTLLLLATVTVTLTMPPGAPAQQIGPTVVLTPDSGVPGDMVSVDGTGFLPGTEVALFIDAIGGTPLNQGTVDSTGRVKVQFPIPDIAPGRHQVIACNPYNPSALFCPDQATATLGVLPPPTTTTSPPLVTETTVQETTTSSLGLQSVTTSTTPDPPGPIGPTGVAFTTTSTSPTIPPGFQDQGTAFYPDLEVTGVEVTQGIQDMQNRMTLVAGKLTMVRVYVGINQPDPTDGIGGLVGDTPTELVGPEGYSPVDGLLYLQRGAETAFVYADNAPITAYDEGSDRHQPDQTLNFILPDGWTSGEVAITAFIWSIDPQTALFIESDSGNNFAEGTVVFHQAVKPQVLVWRLDPVSSPAFTDAGYQSAIATVTESFQMRHPVDTPDFIVFYPPLGPGPLWSGEEPSEEWDLVDKAGEPNDRMKWVYYMSSLSGGIRFLGLIPESTPRKWAGLSNTPVAWSIPNETTPGHEAAHFYGIKHAPCKDDDDDASPDELGGGPVDWTYPHGLPVCSIGPVGETGYYGINLWSSPLEVYSNDPAHSNVRFPWMGYLHPRWTDTYHYCKMGLVYQIPCNPAAIGVPPKVLIPPVDCGPSQGNGFQLDLCLAVEPTAPFLLELGPPGSLALAVAEVPYETWVLVGIDLVGETLGHAMQVPANQAMESDFAFLLERAKSGDIGTEVMLRVTDAGGHIMIQVPVDIHGSGFEEDVDHTDSSTVQPVPWPDGAASLDLLIDGVVVDSLTPSTAPAVTIDPVAAEPGRQFTLTWSGTDPDGDPLLYSVLWSVDGGTTWQVIDTGFPDNSGEIDADALQLPGGQVHLRVTASDGFTTGSDEIGPLTIPTGAPTGFIVGPELVAQHGTEELTFHVNDPEDGPITTGTWTSDLDGELHEGRIVNTRYLSLGTHQISVALTDSDGNQLTLTKQLEVVESDLPALRLQGAVPEAELIVALGPANLDQYPFDPPPTAEEPLPPAAESGIPLAAIWIAIGGLVVLAAGLIWRRTGDRKT